MYIGQTLEKLWFLWVKPMPSVPSHEAAKLPCPVSGFHKGHPGTRCEPVLSMSMALGTNKTKLD